MEGSDVRGVDLGLVAAGGALGAATRWGVGELVGTAHGFPWATLLVNVVGCALIGLAAARLRGAAWWLFAVTGGLGGFTTASTFSVETQRLLDDGRAGIALTYVAASLVGGVGALVLARRA